MKKPLNGKLTVIAGPMYSGKTGKLIALEEVLTRSGRRLAVYKPSLDNRFSTEAKLHSHDAKSTGAMLIESTLPEKTTKEILSQAADTIVFDEVQFFDRKKMITLVTTLQRAGKHVVAAGLLYDYQRKPFGATPDLLGLADERIELVAICQKCGAPARHSERVSGSASQVDVGAGDKYIAVCEKCHTVFRA